jgi:hypothetical protein
VEEKRNIEMNMAQHSGRHPLVGGIYRDKSGSSLVVVNVVGNRVLLEYANGTITSIDVSKWPLLKRRTAAY